MVRLVDDVVGGGGGWPGFDVDDVDDVDDVLEVLDVLDVELVDEVPLNVDGPPTYPPPEQPTAIAASNAARI